MNLQEDGVFGVNCLICETLQRYGIQYDRKFNMLRPRGPNWLFSDQRPVRWIDRFVGRLVGRLGDWKAIRDSGTGLDAVSGDAGIGLP